MNTRTMECLDAIEHLPNEGSLVLHDRDWNDYEELLEAIGDSSAFRVSYDDGTLDIMSPGPLHEECARFIGSLVRILSLELGFDLQDYGSTTWKKKAVQ